VRVLLTGAGGQLGRSLVAHGGSHEIIPLDHARLDVGDLEAVREAISAYDPEIVVNAAAYNAVDRAETDAEAAYRANALGPRHLATAAAKRGIPVLHVSTDYVFDGTSTRPYHEDDAPRPLSVYGSSKLAGEEAVRLANPRHYVVRTAWLYDSLGRNFPRTMLELGAKGSVRVVDDQHGSPTYAPHLALAVLGLIETGAFGTYHLAGSGGTTWFELARTLFREARLDVLVEPASTKDFPRPARRPTYSVLTTIRKPRILLPPWEDGVAAFAREVVR
jgi:dTDP-4-dehydrorhamnose reductase